jgi:hypothetical protein
VMLAGFAVARPFGPRLGAIFRLLPIAAAAHAWPRLLPSAAGLARAVPATTHEEPRSRRNFAQ